MRFFYLLIKQHAITVITNEIIAYAKRFEKPVNGKIMNCSKLQGGYTLRVLRNPNTYRISKLGVLV
ncbi:hypothetical protein DRP04_11375 [Archaeoglobales archaeon]|nr:MAG: hypothetical protein DRP04_11375 [Archaeoglobales archaeon]